MSYNGVSYAYDGNGNRVSLTSGANVTQYLLDTQPRLAQVISSTTGTNTTRYVFSPMGISQQQTPSGAWNWLLQDGLGSVRSVVDSSAAPLENRLYSPYGEATGTYTQSNFGFTGEMTDPNGLVYLRARYMQPSTGMFLSKDPVEGLLGRTMSRNGYSYVENSPSNWTDPSGMIAQDDLDILVHHNTCSQQQNDCCSKWAGDQTLWKACLNRNTGDPLQNQTFGCSSTVQSTRVPPNDATVPPTNTKRPTAPIPSDTATSTLTATPTSTTTSTPTSTSVATPQATNANGTPCPYSNSYFFPPFGSTQDHVPAVLARGFTKGVHEAVDIVPIAVFAPQSASLQKNKWATSYPDYATVYAVKNGNLIPYLDGEHVDLLLQTAENATKAFQYLHVTNLHPNGAVCAGEAIATLNDNDPRANGQTHLHFAYRDYQGGNYYNPTPLFSQILTTQQDIINFPR